MNLRQKLFNLIIGSLLILAAVIIIADPVVGVDILAGFLSITLVAAGIREIVFFFQMGRFMVGGKTVFYTGIIMMDAGILAGAVLLMSKFYVLLYLVGFFAFYGVVTLLRAREEMHFEGSGWKYRILYAVVDLVIAVACVFFIRSTEMMGYIYAGGLIFTALSRFALMRRRVVGVYIQ